VIPVYNNWLYTSLCLDALATSRATEPAIEVIVVDNGSSPKVRERLAEAWSQVDQLAVHPTNLGFAIASNQGARLARGEYVVFLNNERLRTNVTKRAPNRENAQYLVFKLIDRLSQNWRRITGSNVGQLVLSGSTFIDGRLVDREAA